MNFKKFELSNSHGNGKFSLNDFKNLGENRYERGLWTSLFLYQHPRITIKIRKNKIFSIIV